MLQRGAYFYTHEVLGFDQAQNLWLALLTGLTYIAGAMGSHRLTVRLGEKRTLLCVLGALAAIHVALNLVLPAWALVAALGVIALLQGSMWPIFESYMSAGETPRSLGRALSVYNISWAFSTAPALAVAGYLIASGSPRLLFAVAALGYSGVLVSSLWLPAHPAHLAAGHADRPPADVLERYRGLLSASRYAMLGSYTLLYVLAPLMPEIMKNVGFETASAARAASLLDVARFCCFLALFAYSGWHGKKLHIALGIAALPVGFALILLGSNAATVIGGELLFGLAMGYLYTAALYYAQVVQNASVDAGGAHEALIGLGYFLGPGAGLIGTAIAGGAGPGEAGYVTGMSIATLPIVLASTLAAIWPLVRTARRATRPAAAGEPPRAAEG